MPEENIIVNNAQNNALALFRYLRGLSSLRVKDITNIESYAWSCYFTNIPTDTDSENISISYRDRIKEDDYEENNNSKAILSVKKPEFEKCPEPPMSIKKWLNEGWEIYNNEISIKKILTENNVSTYFTDDTIRVSDFIKWKNQRSEWQKKQRKIKITRDFFNKLYSLHVDLNRELEVYELIVGNGFININNK